MLTNKLSSLWTCRLPGNKNVLQPFADQASLKAAGGRLFQDISMQMAKAAITITCCISGPLAAALSEGTSSSHKPAYTVSKLLQRLLNMPQLELELWSSPVLSAVHVRPQLPRKLGHAQQTLQSCGSQENRLVSLTITLGTDALFCASSSLAGGKVAWTLYS